MKKIEKYHTYPQDTRWATEDEITSPLSSVKIDIENPPFESAGLILKSNGKTAYVDSRDNHTMIIGSTGSGKSRLFCIPMIEIMAHAGESFIATDSKGELFNRTSGAAKALGYQVVVLNFRDLDAGDLWNPLLIPYEMYKKGEKDWALSRLNDLVETLTSGETVQDRFWIQMAQSLILANILLLFETAKEDEINMHSLSRLCLDYGKPKHQNVIYQLQKYINPDSIAGINYAGVCIDAEKTQSSIMGVVHSALRVFNTQEGLLRMMSRSTFDMRHFGRRKTAVYLIVPDEKSTFHFLASTFIKQCYEILIGEAYKTESFSLPVRVNFVLDEFANLPTLPDMQNMIAAARSRNIRFYLVIQSMNQLSSRYAADADTISGNCENWVYLNSKEYDFLEEISKRCGNLQDSQNYMRPLITPARLQRLDKEKGEALIFHGRHYPYISYLPDISQYHFNTYEPVRIARNPRSKVAVFHANELLEELKSQKRKSLFYEEELSNLDFDGNHPEEEWNSEEIQERISLLSMKRREIETLPYNEQLSYFLGTQDEMQKLEELVWDGMSYQEKLVEAYQSEAVYRDSQILLCCSVLAGENKEVISYQRKWLLEIGLETLLRMAERQQKMKYPISFDFYPANQDKKDIAAAGTITIMLYALYEKNYTDAEKILRLLEWNQSFLNRYSVYKNWMIRIREILEEMEKQAQCGTIDKRFSPAWEQHMQGVLEVQEMPKDDISACLYRMTGCSGSTVKKQDVQCVFDSCTMQYRQLIHRME